MNTLKKNSIYFFSLLLVGLLFSDCTPEPDITDIELNCGSVVLDCSTAEAWQSAYNNLPNSTTVSCGFKLACGDITTLQDYIDPSNEYKIYVMYVYKPDPDNSGEKEFGLVFRTEIVEGAAITYNYFDFTRPCPKYCPNGQETCGNYPSYTKEDLGAGYWFGRDGLTKVLSSASRLGASPSPSDADGLYLMNKANGDLPALEFLECINGECTSSWEIVNCNLDNATCPEFGGC